MNTDDIDRLDDGIHTIRDIIVRDYNTKHPSKIEHKLSQVKPFSVVLYVTNCDVMNSMCPMGNMMCILFAGLLIDFTLKTVFLF